MTATTADGPTTTADPESSGTTDRSPGRLKRWEKSLARIPPVRMLVAVPRTCRFAGKTVVRRVLGSDDAPPVPRLSAGLLLNVALDETALLVAMGPNRFPRRADYLRVKAELAAALELFEARGWLKDPASYHHTPPDLERPRIGSGWAAGVAYERLNWDSGFEPHEDEPGRDRWLDYATNRTAGAWVLRHDDGPRPWLVCVHGFGMGYPFMEFMPFDVARLHHEYGLNLIGPTLPLHGRRKITRMSGDAFLSFDMMNAVHGLTQSVWDIRRALSWVRTQEPTAIGVYGISLGGYVTSLLTAHDDGLDAVVAGIPVSDFPALYHSHAPTHIRLRSAEHDILGGSAEQVHRVVSPLAVAPKVPRDRRFIYAALGDRLARPQQAHNLWKHWDRPTIEWYSGSHISFIFTPAVRRFVRRSLAEAGLIEPALLNEPDAQPA